MLATVSAHVWAKMEQAKRVGKNALYAQDVDRGVDEAIVDLILQDEANLEISSDEEWSEQPTQSAAYVFKACDDVLDCLFDEVQFKLLYIITFLLIDDLFIYIYIYIW